MAVQSITHNFSRILSSFTSMNEPKYQLFSLLTLVFELSFYGSVATGLKV